MEKHIVRDNAFWNHAQTLGSLSKDRGTLDNKRIFCYLFVKIYFFCCVYVKGTLIALDIFCTLVSLLIKLDDISVCIVGPLVTCVVLLENWMH
jgi:hypothetical protein